MEEEKLSSLKDRIVEDLERFNVTFKVRFWRTNYVAFP